MVIDMSKNIYKGIILAFLIVVSIYQTGRLWFDDLSNRNFFYSVFGGQLSQEKTITNAAADLIKPWKMVAYYPSDAAEFMLIKNTRKEFDDIQKSIRGLIQQIVKYGDHGEMEELNWEKLFQFPSVLYEYAFPLTSGDLEGVFNSGQNDLMRKMPQFDQILFIPPANNNNPFYCYFINTIENKMYSVQWEPANGKNKSDITYLANELKSIELKSIPNYVSSKRIGVDRFSRNVFLPGDLENIYYKEIMLLGNPLLEDNEFKEEEVSNYVNGFFSNPVLVWSIKKEDYWVYGDDNIQVRVYPSGIVEYFNTKIKDEDSSVSLNEANQIAGQFLQKDKYVVQENLEYYLASYKKDQKGIYLYYKYRYDNFPYVLSSTIVNDDNIEYPIEIYIENGDVKYYKRLIRITENYSHAHNKQLKESYTSVLNRFYETLKAEEVQQEGKLDDLYLGYYQDELDSVATMMWIIKYNGKSYVLPIK